MTGDALLRRLRPTVAVAIAALVLAPAIPAAAGARHAPRRADQALDRALERYVASEGGPPAIAVVVQRHGRPVLHAAGTSEVGTNVAPRIDDHVRVASVAKAFSGAVALSVVADGKLDLDDTIGEVRPDLPDAWSRVTLRQLLQHTSGIPDFSQTEAFGNALRASLLDPPPPVELLSFVADEPLLFRPGSRYQYSNSDNIIVALMVETATGRSYANALARRVAQPLGLRRTSLPEGATMPTPFVHGYALEPPAPPEDVSEIFAAGWSWASGGVVATPGDSNRFVRGYAAGATTDHRTRAQQFRFVRGGSSEPPGPGRNAAGLALFRYQTRCGTVYGHTGNTAGYTHFIAATRDGSRSTSVSVSAQVTPDTDAEGFPVLRRIFGLAVCAAKA
jgi:D-alanyl-D-alanine carboxypeptidase